MSTIDVTDQDFQEKVIDSDKPVIVDFWAVWCGPCRQLSPVLEEIGEKYSEKVTVAKVNVDDNSGIAHNTVSPVSQPYSSSKTVKRSRLPLVPNHFTFLKRIR